MDLRETRAPRSRGTGNAIEIVVKTRASKRADGAIHGHARARRAQIDAEMWTGLPSARGQIALSFNPCRILLNDVRRPIAPFVKSRTSASTLVMRPANRSLNASHRDTGPTRCGSAQLLDACGIPIGESDSGLIVVAVDSPDAADQFVAAIATHRHFARETDPPRV